GLSDPPSRNQGPFSHDSGKSGRSSELARLPRNSVVSLPCVGFTILRPTVMQFSTAMGCFRPQDRVEWFSMDCLQARCNSTDKTDFRHMRLETPPIAVFQDRAVPPGTRLAGWAALVQALAVSAPVRRLSCVSEQH